MALVTTNFTVNITPGAMPPIVHVSEYDVGRAYTVSILDEQGNTFTIPSGTTASIEGTLNGKVGFTQSASISNNQVSFTLTESMTAYSGNAWCKIKLTLNDEPIQTCAFILDVDRAGVNASAIINAPGFQGQINQGVADYMAHHTVRAEDERLDSVVTFTEEIGRVPLFTNVIPLSVDTDGTPYQNGAGYLDGYRLNSSGTLTEASDSGVTGFIPLPLDKHGSILRFENVLLRSNQLSNSGKGYIATYDSTKSKIASSQTAQAGSRWSAAAQVDADGYIAEIDLAQSGEISNSVEYIRISADYIGADSIITIDEEIAYDEHGEIVNAALKPNVTIPQLDPLDARITALENDSGTIDSTDPLVKYAKQIDNGLTVGYEPTLTGRPTANLVAKKYLNFLHISDTHGSVNAENAVKILNKLKADGRCSFLIHTGDFHASTFADVASWNAFAGYIAQANAPVLLVSGNHDVGNNSQSTTNGQTATDAQLYARCFEPYISGWNLTSHPTGKCYWYKDFADEGVRLIGLYDFESDYATDSTTGDLLKARGYAAYHQAQIDWLVQALLTCPAGYGVIIAKHNPMNKRGTLDNPFNGEFLQGQNTSQSYVSKDMIAEIVQAFMDGTTINESYTQTGNVTDTLTVNQSFANKNSGAHFVCYLDGHTHADGVNFLADFPNQLELNIGCDNYHYQHYADTLNQQGTLHQDLLNYVSVDVNRGYVYIQRIGNDYTAQADRRDFTAIDYKNPPTAADDPTEAIESLDDRTSELEALADDWPLLKSYTAVAAVSDRLDIMLDRPAKRMRIKIAGVANSDVSANITPTIYAFCADPSTTSFAPHNLKKIAYRPIVSASPATLLCDWKNDSQMQLSVAQSFFGAVSLTSNGWLNVVDATLAPSVGSYVAHGIRIDKSGSVVATTGMIIEIYGLEA